MYLTFEIDAYTFRTLNSKFHKSSTLFSSSSDSPNQKPPKRRIADVFRIFLLCPVPQDLKPINDTNDETRRILNLYEMQLACI